MVKKLHFQSTKFIFSILDQGFFSGSNFILNLILARYLIDSDYGAFSYGFSFFILFSSVLTSFVIEPTVVYGSKKNTKLNEFISNSTILQFFLSILVGIIIIVFGLFQSQIKPSVLIVLGCSFPFMMIFWILRQSCYIELKTKRAFFGSFIYFLSTIIGLLGVMWIKKLSAFTGFVIMGFSCTSASIYLMLINKISIIPTNSFYSEFNNFWNYGKWIIPASISSWLTTSAIIPIISIISNLAIAGAYKAIQNFYLPLQQFLSAIYLLLLPLLSKTISNGDKKKTKNILFLSISALSIFSIIYLILINAFNKPFILLVYNKPSYSESSYLSIFIGLSVLTVLPGQILSLFLRSIEKTIDIFFIKIINLVFFIIVGIIFVNKYQLIGILITLVLLGLIESGSSLFFVLKRKKNL